MSSPILDELYNLRKANKELREALTDIVHRASPTGNNVLLKRIVAIAESANQKSYGKPLSTTPEPQRRYKPEHNGESNPGRCVR